MTLSDCSVHSGGVVAAIGGSPQTHRRLVDLGLGGAEFYVRAKRKRSMLVDFGAYSAVIERTTAANITVLEVDNEDRALRKPKRRQDHAV